MAVVLSTRLIPTRTHPPTPALPPALGVDEDCGTTRSGYRPPVCDDGRATGTSTNTSKSIHAGISVRGLSLLVGQTSLLLAVRHTCTNTCIAGLRSSVSDRLGSDIRKSHIARRVIRTRWVTGVSSYASLVSSGEGDTLSASGVCHSSRLSSCADATHTDTHRRSCIRIHGA
ncbi:hypothetical protein BC629DRAFT_1536309 [Irpex lacteus]|nr:hypothetical protein BC629DRAFT_1536309 [Irpex lacteus]